MKKKKGFTLVKLLAVIVILAVKVYNCGSGTSSDLYILGV